VRKKWSKRNVCTKERSGGSSIMHGEKTGSAENSNDGCVVVFCAGYGAANWVGRKGKPSINGSEVAADGVIPVCKNDERGRDPKHCQGGGLGKVDNGQRGFGRKS